MSALPVVDSAQFRCEYFRCTLKVSICIQRQDQRRKSGPTGILKPVHDFCASGKCKQGAENRTGVSAPVEPPAVLPQEWAVYQGPPASKPVAASPAPEMPSIEAVSAPTPQAAPVAAARPPPAETVVLPAEQARPAEKTHTPERRSLIGAGVRAAYERRRASGLVCSNKCGRVLRSDSKGGMCGHCRRAAPVPALQATVPEESSMSNREKAGRTPPPPPRLTKEQLSIGARRGRVSRALAQLAEGTIDDALAHMSLESQTNLLLSLREMRQPYDLLEEKLVARLKASRAMLDALVDHDSAQEGHV